MRGAASAKQTNITKAYADTGLDPVVVFSAMAPDAINFSTPVAEMMVRQLDVLRPSKQNIKALNKDIRTVPAEKRDKAFPDFLGVDHPDVIFQLNQFGNGAMRKAVVAHMRKAKWKDKGFPIHDDIVNAITEPDLLNEPAGASGFSMFEGRPGASLIDESGHLTYDTGIPGQHIGGLQKSIPPEVMFPKTFKVLSQQKNRAGVLLPRDQQVGALRAKYLWEVADQEWVDNVATFLEQNPGSNKVLPSLLVGGTSGVIGNLMNRVQEDDTGI
jgi:hypothetical protein|tara:strand:+ start:370 stop:1182 length:813 start_codon:yes stop_codon:yes gene_type:complete